MPKVSSEDLSNLIVKKPDKFIIIFFNPGMAGSSLLRILIGHKELYHSFKNLGQSDYDDPLRYPDTWEGFSCQFPHILSMKEQHIACAHVDFHTPFPYGKREEKEEDFREYFSLIKQGETIVLKTHDFELYEKFKKSKCIFIREDTALGRNINQPNTGNPPFLPKEALVVTIDKLMSKDYDTFLSEYLKLVLELKLTPRINSVRAFILMWLERQERMKRSLS
jgi:hypothetical protein